MNSKKLKTFKDNVSIEEIFKTFLKEKTIIIIVSLAFSILFGLLYYYIGVNHIKKNQNLASVKETFVYQEIDNLFRYYNNLEPNDIYAPYDYRIDLINSKYKFSSSDFAYFYEQNKDKFVDFNDYFEKSNISVRDYFFNNFKQENNIFYLNFPKELQGEFLLKEFFIFELNRYKLELEEKIKKNILAHINFVEKIKQIINKQNFVNSKWEEEKYYYIIDWNIFSNKFRNIENLDYTIFFSKEVIKKLENNDFNYPFNFNIQTDVKPIEDNYAINSLKNFILVGLIFGFLLSLIIVFFKNLVKED